MADTTILADAVEQLYAAPPAEFVRTRSALAADAKAAGETDAVREVRALRKPTLAAYLVNTLVRRHSGDVADLADLGDRLRAAQSQLDGAAMKELGAERLTLVGRLTDRACEATDCATAAVREQISDTLTAALADPAAHAALSDGALVTSLRYNGFGEVDLSDAVAAPLRVIRGGRSSDNDRGAAQQAGHAGQDAHRKAARSAANARSARAQAKMERAEETAAAAARAQERAEKQLTDARTALQRAQDACAAANTAQNEARAEVAAAEREQLHSAGQAADRD